MRISFIIIVGLLFLVSFIQNINNLFFSNSDFTLQFVVKKNAPYSISQVLNNYSKDVVVETESFLKIRNASLFEVIAYDFPENQILDPFLTMTVSLLFFICIWNYHKYGLFHKNLTIYIASIGLCFLISYLIHRLQTELALNYIKQITFNEYILNKNFNKQHVLKSFIGMILIFLSGVYYEAYKLNKQQELTI